MTDQQAKRRSLRVTRWWLHCWNPGRTFRDDRQELFLSLGSDSSSRPDWPVIAYVGEHCTGKMHIDIFIRDYRFSNPRTPKERKVMQGLARRYRIQLGPKRKKR